MAGPFPDDAPLSAAEFRRRRRARNLALGLAFAGLGVLFFVMAMARFGATLR